MSKYLSIVLLSFLVACGGGSEEKKDDKTTDKDTTETVDSNTIDVEEATENPEEVSIEEFEKSGEGMALCDCVKLVKAMDDEMMADATSEERMEEIMAEKDKLVDSDCKVLKMGGQDSPEERAERQRQIKACK